MTPRVSQMQNTNHEEKTQTSSEAMDQEALESESTIMLEDWFGEHPSTSAIVEPAHNNINSDIDVDS